MFSGRGFAQDIPPEIERAISLSASCEAWEEATKTSNETNEYCQFLRGGVILMELENVKGAYHADVNGDLNDRMARVSPFGTCDGDRRRNIVETNFLDVYTDNKVRFYQYHAALKSLQSRSYFSLPKGSAGGSSLRAFGTARELADEIEWELERSRIALNVALNEYAQMRLLLSLDGEMKCLISELNSLRSSWEDFIHQVSRIPRKFLNSAAKP